MDIWVAVCQERLGLADRLAGIDETQWNITSLCDRWRIRDVAAHVTAGAQGAFGIGATLAGLIAHGFNFNRWIAADGRRRGDEDPVRILDDLRGAAANRKSPPGAPTIAVLTDVMIHGQDIGRPLGLQRDFPEERWLPVCDFVRSTFVFGAKTRTAGLTLRATDMEWSHGSGPEVTGSAEALVMVMAGRGAVLADLAGEGVATLTARF
ncbi:MAG TPA: maleylpyruvate isomerase family mycothiol-dependent enzyme [Acidimicrobiales bacterium]|jgi:uncharacterized protein (TIGR03083 family)